VFDNITLGIERKHWKENIPGNGTSVQISSTQTHDGRTLGRAATTNSQEVIVSSKQVYSNLTHIFVDDGGVFGSNLLDAALPYSLLPAAPAVDDAVYFGNDVDIAPFSSLVFDLLTALSGTLTVVWEYSDGAAGWPTLTTFDFNTDDLGFTGVETVAWVNPSDWVTELVNGVTALWVRLRVSAFTSITTVAQQQNRNVYASMMGHVNTVAAQVGGDIPALNFTTTMTPVLPIVSSLTDQEVYSDRVIMALRSVSRGDTFTPYLHVTNAASNPSPYASFTQNDTTRVTDPTAAWNVRATYNPPGIQPFASRAYWAIVADFNDYLGSYHVFVRARQSGGDIGDINIRLGVLAFAQDDMIIRTRSKSVRPISEWDLIDLGVLTLVPNFIPNPTFAILEFHVEAECTVGVSIPDLYIQDLILMPVDEWSGDFYQDTARKENGRFYQGLEIDPISHPKKPTFTLRSRSQNRLLNFAVPVLNGTPILQANAEQELYFLLAQYYKSTGTHTGANNQATLTDASADFVNEGVEIGMEIVNETDNSRGEITGVTVTTITVTLLGGTDNDWDTNDVYYIMTDKWISRHEQCVYVNVQRNNRYLGMRGER
jgi:hypothetical protein